MGAPSDNDADRKADPEDEIDDGWTTASPAHNDQTTAGLYVDPASLGQLIAGKGRLAASSGQAPTTTGVTATTEDEQTIVGPTITEDSTVAAVDQVMDVLEAPNAIVNNDRTKLGIGVPTPTAAAAVTTAPRPRFALLQPGKDPVPLQPAHALVQPERSPLAFVMGDQASAAPAQAHASGDSSRFLASFIGDQPPPARVEAESPVITAMQPVLRKSRLRRRWIAVGALAAMALVGTVFALTMTGADETPKTAASEAAKVNESPFVGTEPQAAPSHVAAQADPAPTEIEAAPTPSDLDTPNTPTTLAQVAAPPNVEPEAPRAELRTVAVATTTPKATKTLSTTTKPATARKTVATKDVAPKKSAPATKATTAKKPATAKKSTATAVAKKPAPAKKPAATKPTTTAKKVATTKSAPTAKKTPTKKTSTKKSTRSQRSSRRARRSS